MTKTRKCKTTGVDTTTNEAEATQEGELTARERAAVERLQTAEQAVRLVFTEDGKLTPDHQNKSVGWAQIAELLGSTNLDFAAGLVKQLYAASEDVGGGFNQAKFNYLFAIVTSSKPKDESQARLCAEQALVHAVLCKEARCLLTMGSFVGSAAGQMSVSDLCKLVRASVALDAAIMRHRAGGVSVQNLIVSEGGQAFVGNVTRPERGPSPEMSQASPPALTRSQAVPMPVVEEAPRAVAPLARKAAKRNGKHVRSTRSMLESPRCGAKTRSGRPCRAPAVFDKKRCRMHGGAHGSGAPKGNQNALKQGLYTKDAREERRKTRERIRNSRKVLQNRGGG